MKGSGSDLGTMQAKHFTGLRMEDIRPLIEREDMSDEDMVAYLTHCMVDTSIRAFDRNIAACISPV